MGQEGALIDDTEAGKFTTFPEVPIATFRLVVMISTCWEFGGYKIAGLLTCHHLSLNGGIGRFILVMITILGLSVIFELLLPLGRRQQALFARCRHREGRKWLFCSAPTPPLTPTLPTCPFLIPKVQELDF